MVGGNAALPLAEVIPCTTGCQLLYLNEPLQEHEIVWDKNKYLANFYLEGVTRTFQYSLGSDGHANDLNKNWSSMHYGNILEYGSLWSEVQYQ